MARAPRISVSAPAEARARFLAATYAWIAEDPARLDGLLRRLAPIRGAKRVASWRALAAEGDLAALAFELVTAHYDPAYTRARKRSGAGAALGAVALETLEPAAFDRAARDVVARLDRWSKKELVA